MQYKTNDTVIALQPKSKHLTHGKVYIVEWISTGGYVAVRNDSGKIKPYAQSNFHVKEDFTMIKRTIGGHNVRNLYRVDKITLKGEVSSRWNPESWEEVIFIQCKRNPTYYACNLGEWWDIDLND